MGDCFFCGGFLEGFSALPHPPVPVSWQCTSKVIPIRWDQSVLGLLWMGMEPALHTCIHEARENLSGRQGLWEVYTKQELSTIAL